MIEFDRQAVIVTGAGRGLGRLDAMEMADRGASVVVNDLGGSVTGDGADPSVADQVVEEVRRRGGEAIASYDSVDSIEGGEAIVRRALDAFGRLDDVVSNAGIFHTASFDELSPSDRRHMQRGHLDGAFYVSQPAFRHMKSEGYGRFGFVASSAGLFGQPSSAHYAGAKSGVMGLANGIAIEGEPYGILANTVLPFGFSRLVTSTIGEELAESLRQDPGFMQVIEPELVVPLVVFLASRACELTHHNYSACAGRFARVFLGSARAGWPIPDLTFS